MQFTICKRKKKGKLRKLSKLTITFTNKSFFIDFLRFQVTVVLGFLGVMPPPVNPNVSKSHSSPKIMGTPLNTHNLRVVYSMWLLYTRGFKKIMLSIHETDMEGLSSTVILSKDVRYPKWCIIWKIFKHQGYKLSCFFINGEFC